MQPRLRHLLAAAFMVIATVPVLILGFWVKATTVALALILFGLIVAALMSWMVSGLLVRPVEAVVRTAREIAEGNLESRVPQQHAFAPKEFQELGPAFNAMARDIATVMIQRERIEGELRHAHDKLELRVEERTRELTEEIAERQEAEEARERLSQAVENVPVGIALFDSDDRLVFFNSRYAELMDVMADILKPGVSFEEMIRTMVDRQPVKDALGREEEFIQERVKHHRNPTGPFDIRRENMWLVANENRLSGGGIFTIISDITERKQAETLQRGRNRVLERLATGGSLEEVLSLLIATAEEVNPNTLGSVLLLDEDGKHLLHGAAPSLPDFYNQAIDGMEIGDGEGSCGTAAYSGEMVIVEDVMTHPYWVDFRDLAAKANVRACWSQPIFSAAGEVLGTFAMYYREPRRPTPLDMEVIETAAQLAGVAIERKRMEEALRQSEERLRGAIGSLQEGFALFDADDRLVALNDEYRRVSHGAQKIMERGGTFEDVIRANVASGRIADVEGREEEFIQERLESHRNPGEPIIRRFKGGQWFLIKEAKTPEGGTAVSFTDITDLKKAEEALRESKDDAEFASRAKTEFLANMSHELRTPLNSIIGFSDILMDESFVSLKTQKAREYMRDINDSGKHLLELINDVIDVARIERGLIDLNEKKLDVPLLMASCQRLVNDRAFNAGVHLTSDVSKSLPALLADELRTKQILLNLLSNAIKFTPEGGEVSLRAFIDKDDRFRLSVKDTGIGIEPENIETALSDFGQVDGSLARKYDGAGLGLPLSRKLAELHGGELFIESIVGTGTTVTVLFPSERTIQIS